MRYEISFRHFLISKYFIISLILFLSCLFLIPKVSVRIPGFKRTYLRQRFLAQIKKEKRIDFQSFWQFREFYSPGYFVFDKTTNPFLIYKSPLIYSEERLITDDKLSNYYNEKELLSKKIILKTKDTLVYYQDKTAVKIIFIKPKEDMEKTIGYFDYKEKDKELVKDKNWLNITYIRQI